MAIAVDNTTAVVGQASSSTTQTLAHTVGSGDNRLLMVVASQRQTNTITSVTYNGVSMTQIDEIAVSGNHKESLWYLVAPATGTNNIVVTINSANTGICCGAVSFTGVDQSNPIDNSAKDSSVTTTTSYSRSITTVADNTWLFFGGRANGGATLTAGANTVVSSQPEVAVAGIFHMRSSGAQTPAGSKSLAVTSSSQGFDGIIASIKPFVAPSAPATLKTFNTVSTASVKTVDTTAIASVKTINTAA